MGIFDRLFRRTPAAPDASPEGASPASEGPGPASATPAVPQGRARVARAARHPAFDWDWGNEHAHRLVHEILGEVAPRFGTPERPAKIKELPDDENIDLRGSYLGSPVRFAVWMSFGSFWSIEMRAPMWTESFTIDRDLEKIPKQGDADDPWSEDEERRVFLARGIFVEGDDATVERRIALWDRLTEAARDRIVADMERLDARSLIWAGNTVLLSQRPGLPELDDPGAYFEGCAALLHALVEAVQGAGLIDEAPSGVEATLGLLRSSCNYCSTVFMAGAAHPNCPNCGAPPRA